MDPAALKQPNLLRNILARLLSFGVVIFAVRFAYLVAVTGGSCNSAGDDFCFFPRDIRAANGHVPPDSSASGMAVDHYSSVFNDLVAEGFLSPASKSLCVETLTGEEVLALRETGVADSIGISTNGTPPLVLLGEGHRQPFEDNTFDFEFTNGLDRTIKPVQFGSEICRTLKSGGFVVIHTRAKDPYSLQSLLDLFNCCNLIKWREISSSDPTAAVREIILKKEIRARNKFNSDGNKNCVVPGFKREIIRKAEPLIRKEPLKPWVTLKKNIKHLTSMADISFKHRYIYIDVGARSYGSSIGNWFMKTYPKQNKTFEIYAIEGDKAFHGKYRRKKGVTLLPYAAWVRNETLFFGITRDPTKKVAEKGARGTGIGRIQMVQPSANHMLAGLDKIEGFDFASWLKSMVGERDLVVVKMDVEGSEFHLVRRLVETNAMCLIDEMFLECHYNGWQRCCPGQSIVKYPKTYDQCFQLFNSLRESGVLVHQWW